LSELRTAGSSHVEQKPASHCLTLPDQAAGLISPSSSFVLQRKPIARTHASNPAMNIARLSCRRGRTQIRLVEQVQTEMALDVMDLARLCRVECSVNWK
jgi:hypothetical protein